MDRRKKQPEQPDPKAFERFEALAEKVLNKTARSKRGAKKKRRS